MKSKYYQALFFIGILPVLALTGVYFWILFNQAPAPKSPTTNMAAVQAALPLLKTEVDSMANQMAAAIDKINAEIPNLYAHNTDADLDTFIHTHSGISGIAMLSPEGKVQRIVPASPPLITDPSYGASEEFQKTVEKLKSNGGKPHLFYTLKLGYPAFVFAVSTNTQSVAEAIISLADFFRHMDPKGGDFFLLEAGSGNIFYDTNPAKVGANFNPNQEAWLAGAQDDLINKRSSSKFNPDQVSGVWAPVFAKFGIVHTFPSSILQPSSPASSKSTAPSLENLPQFFQTFTGMTIMVAFFATLGWVCIVGIIFFGLILSPLRKASGAILNAANDKGPLTADTVRRFGKDEVGQVVQAAAMLMDKLEKEKQAANQEKEEALRRGAAQVDAKTKEAAGQVAAAQQQAQATRNELNEKNQLLNDKLKEMDALKSMSEGLRNQTEQAKGEIGKLKAQITSTDQSKAETELKFKESQLKAEAQLKAMEAKLLEAVGASSAIKVSQVRAAAIRTMSEELKTTLGIIKGYVSSALGASQGGINEKQQEFLGMVINRSARLEKFINDLVDIYQVEIEQESSVPEEVNLASEIEGLAFNFQAQAEVKNIKIKVEPKGTLPKVPIVRRRFNQLWNILYLQIIKDAPRASSITILVEPLGSLVKVTVHDPGLMVTPESLPKLFDEFYDPKHPGSPQLAGTGLKFALIKTILASHGGGAVAEKADPGTKLILTFPTKWNKPGDMPAPMVGASPSVTAPGLKAGVTPTLGIGAVRPTVPGMPAPPAMGLPKPPPPSIGAPGLPRPAVPGSTGPPQAGMAPPGLPRPAGPGMSGTPSMGAPPAMGAPGLPKPAVPTMPGTPASAPGLPKPPAPAGGGMLDALISGKPPAPAAPSPAAAPGMAAPPRPAMPGIPLSGGMPAPASAPKPPAPGGGLLDALIDKKPAVPPAGIPSMPPRPAVPPPSGMGAPPMAPRPAMPGAPAPAPGMPGTPSMGAAPRPVMPPTPGAPSAAPGMAPRPVTPGAPPAAPGMPPAGAPKVVPTGLKPAPAPGVLDLDSADGMKTEVKPPVPRPPMPGAPPAGAPKPPAPGVPPGGLNAAPQPPKKDEGELIE